VYARTSYRYAFALRRERVEGRGSNLSLLKEANEEREKRSAGCSAPFTAGPGYRMCEMCEMCEMRSERPVQGPRTREKGEKATNTTAGHSIGVDGSEMRETQG